MTDALVADALGFRYPGGHGFKNISFHAPGGKIIGIFGRNGSGKTTLLRVLSTLTLPQAGRFYAGGFDVSTDRSAVRGQIFPVYDTNAHFEHLSGRENIELFLFLYGISAPHSLDELAAVFDLDLDRKAGEYSLGMKRKLSLIESLLCSRPVMFFDEPALGLDSDMRARFFALLRDAAGRGSCIIIFTNRIEDTAFADQIFRLEKGDLAKVTTTGELLEGLIRVTYSFPDSDVTEYIGSIGDLPELTKKMILRGIPRKIEITCTGAAGTETCPWSPEARKKVGRAPRFLRTMIETLVERHACEAGYLRITPEVVDEARGRFGRL
jgi:ABC-type multidrug transport system ATPase subunit